MRVWLYMAGAGVSSRCHDSRPFLKLVLVTELLVVYYIMTVSVVLILSIQRVGG